MEFGKIPTLEIDNGKLYLDGEELKYIKKIRLEGDSDVEPLLFELHVEGFMTDDKGKLEMYNNGSFKKYVIDVPVTIQSAEESEEVFYHGYKAVD